MYLIISV